MAGTGSGVAAASSGSVSVSAAVGAADSSGSSGAVSVGSALEKKDSASAAAKITSAAESSIPSFFQKPALKKRTIHAITATMITTEATSAMRSPMLARPSLHARRIAGASRKREKRIFSLSQRA